MKTEKLTAFLQRGKNSALPVSSHYEKNTTEIKNNHEISCTTYLSLPKERLFSSSLPSVCFLVVGWRKCSSLENEVGRSDVAQVLALFSVAAS